MKRKKISEPISTESEPLNTEPEFSDVTEDQETPQACGAWMFLFGASFNAFCQLPQEHENEHRIEVAIHSEPKSHFTIFWTLDK